MGILLLDLSIRNKLCEIHDHLMEGLLQTLKVNWCKCLYDCRYSIIVLDTSVFKLVSIRLNFKGKNLNNLDHNVHVWSLRSELQDVLHTLKNLISYLEILNYYSRLKKHFWEVFICCNCSCSSLIVMEDSQLHELEEVVHYLV